MQMYFFHHPVHGGLLESSNPVTPAGYQPMTEDEYRAEIGRQNQIMWAAQQEREAKAAAARQAEAAEIYAEAAASIGPKSALFLARQADASFQPPEPQVAAVLTPDGTAAIVAPDGSPVVVALPTT